MNQKALLIAGGSVAAAAFLLGFIPQYLKARNLDDQLGATRQELKLRQDELQMAGLSLLIGQVYLEVNQKNFGLASQDSTQFFDRVRSLSGSEMDPGRKAYLEEALAARDQVTAALAKGDPSALPAVQDLFQHALRLSAAGGH
jgi:hypothetical protein